MELLVGIVLIVLALVVIMFGRALRRVIRKQERLWGSLDASGVQRGVDFLLRRGYDGGTARFSEDGTGFSVQFRKYINPNAAIGLEMQFPREPWSESHYSDVQAMLNRLASNGIGCRQMVSQPPK